MSATAERVNAREAAIAYSARGWPVFPLHPVIGGRCGCGDRACTATGKHPVIKGWQNTIPSVAAAETSWRGGLATRGIGLVCGARAGVFGIDADRRHGADETLGRWRREGRRSGTVIDETGDGWHLLYRWPSELAVEIRAQDLGGGLQCRGAGHFLVLAPSMHHTGARYRWIRSPEDCEIAEAPDWLLDLIASKSRRAEPIMPEGEQALVPVGHRHDALVRFLGLMRSMGFGEAALVGFTDVFLDTSVEIDEQRCPLDRDAARRDAVDIARRYPPHPNRGEDRRAN